MLVVDNFHVKIRYTYTNFFHVFHMFFKNSVGFKLFKYQIIFLTRNTQYSIKLIVHKQPSVFNTTYTIQCSVNCPYEKNVYNCFEFLHENY